MKPTIPESGSVIKTEGLNATVLLEGGTACKGCGAGKIGLCRPAGNSMTVTVGNSAGAQMGDKVLIGIDRGVQRTAYLLAYIIPLVSFLSGSFLGHAARVYFTVPALDAITGFAALAAASVFSLRKLKKLDASSRMSIKRILNDNRFEIDLKSDEELRYESCRLD